MDIYTLKNDAFGASDTWTLTDEALKKSQNEMELLVIPYRGIKSIRLYYNPLKYRTNNFECEIITLNNQKTKLRSTSYVSLANFENKAETYNLFIQNLVTKVSTVNPLCRITTGTPKLRFIANSLFVFIIVTVVALMLSLFAGALPASLLMFGYYLFYIIKGFRRNWPQHIMNQQIPAQALAKV